MAGKLSVAVQWQGRPWPGVTRRLRQVAVATLERVGVVRGELSVLLCDDRTIELLNSHFRKICKPTDVLSFPAHDRLPTGVVHLGDVAISLETAARQAAAAGHSVERELCLLLIHGVLHVCGYDHEQDQGEMEELEAQLREELL